MTAVATEVDVSVLEDLDFEIECQHSQHHLGDEAHHDGGPATFWIEVVHDCAVEPAKGVVYAACEAYGLYTIRDAYNWWRCAKCNEVTIVCQAVKPVGRITKEI